MQPNVQHPDWMKSVYGKTQPLIGGNSFSLLYDSVWTSAGSLRFDYSEKIQTGDVEDIEFPGVFKK